MALTRRQFIKRDRLATAAELLGPHFSAILCEPRSRRQLGDRYFVVIFLDGGNDGLNTVVPYDNGSGLRDGYNDKRSTSGQRWDQPRPVEPARTESSPDGARR